MTNRLVVVLSVAAFLAAPAANAALVNAGQLTLDTSTGIEWLDPAIFDGQTYDQVLSGKWVTAGWQVATLDQVISLVQEYAGATFGEITLGSAAYTQTQSFVDTLGATYAQTDPGVVNDGIFGYATNGVGTVVVGEINAFSIAGYTGNNFTGVSVFDPTQVIDSQAGAFLIWDQPGTPAVPAPELSSWIMTLLGFLGLSIPITMRKRTVGGSGGY